MNRRRFSKRRRLIPASPSAFDIHAQCHEFDPVLLRREIHVPRRAVRLGQELLETVRSASRRLSARYTEQYAARSNPHKHRTIMLISMPALPVKSESFDDIG